MVTPLDPGVRDVVLRQGLTLRLRPPTRDDADAVTEFLKHLSADSLFMRFHGGVAVAPSLVNPVLDPDWVERGALVGVTGERAKESVVALGNYVRLHDPGVAEVAFAVADELQGQGVGTRLLEQLAELAAALGIERFVAEVLPDNRAMLRVFEDAGFVQTRTLEGGVVEVSLSIEPTSSYLEQLTGAITSRSAPRCVLSSRRSRWR